jgi:sec-independent protein translocase protein TatB
VFDIAWSELALIGVVALVVIGPKDLPRVMRTLGQWTRRARAMAAEFQRNLDDMVREAELDEIRKEVEKVSPAEFKSNLEKLVDAKSIEEAVKIEEPVMTAAPTVAPAPTPEPTPAPTTKPRATRKPKPKVAPTQTPESET